MWGSLVSKQIKISVIGLLAVMSHVALSQQASPDATSSPPATRTIEIGEIVVTAQKRSESINSVPMSITAVPGDTLIKMGIDQPAGLSKISSGFNFAETAFASPVYSIRGVGFYETSLAATPAVTVYTDEVPLPYPQMTRNAGMDVERVEILKGPQGTLFGQNSTGGAVNYIAAKPTDAFNAGVDASYGRFNSVDLSGFVSGPVTDTISARFALKTAQGSGWQRSYTRDDSRGQKNIDQARLLIDFKPIDGWKSELRLSGWQDKSDTLGMQLAARTPSIPPLAVPAFLVYPLAPNDPRAADWTPGERNARNDNFYQASLRNDIDIAPRLTLTAITAFSHLNLDAPVDVDGTALRLFQSDLTGAINSLSQEIRISGSPENGIHWLVGGDFALDHTTENDNSDSPDAVFAHRFGPYFNAAKLVFEANTRARTYAGFANLEVPITDVWRVQGGVRYTDSRTDFSGCTHGVANDPGGTTPAFQALLNALRGSIGAPPISLGAAGCATFDSSFTPLLVVDTLKEDNVAWRVGLDYKPAPDTLAYVNVSKGYKAGTFASIGATEASQYSPAKQEALLAYEAGFKSSFDTRRLQLNGAIFYYDYTNKQLRGSVQDPILGSLDKLVNVPKSHVVGAEIQLVLQPIDALRVMGGATYAESKVTSSFLNYNPYGVPVNFKGESFPYTPRLEANVDTEYSFPLVAHTEGFVGAGAEHRTTTSTAFGGLPLFRIPAYTLVDLRAGIDDPDQKWRVWLWGRNVLNKFYYTSLSFAPSDATVRSPGMPAMFGVSASYRF
jgi:iron complex outermembrane receptor protein